MLENKDTVSERIKILFEHFGNGNLSAFARELNVSAQAIRDLMKGEKGGPSWPVLQNILRAFPSISADWLVLGQGDMLRPAHSTPNGIVTVRKQNEQLLDIIRSEVAEQMAATKPLGEVHKLLNEELARKRGEYALSWEEDAVAIRAEIAKYGDAQVSTAFELEHRVGEIIRAIYVLRSIEPGSSGLAPSIAYRVVGEPDFTKPFDGLLSRRLNISEDEAIELVKQNEIGHLHIDDYGYEVSEDLVRQHLWRIKRQKSAAT